MAESLRSDTHPPSPTAGIRIMSAVVPLRRHTEGTASAEVFIYGEKGSEDDVGVWIGALTSRPSIVLVDDSMGLEK
jgi:hypothetical protein